ncbi:Protein HGH1 [Hypsizygus marmoreus]|uniref:Protein HGH1 n=1 Tax=Hypsizygus marmoreus TaxID=39966 RepID=A0A369JND7_HYPMA|nr:Protein HGH1 [Hypsizygus marmoreus]
MDAQLRELIPFLRDRNLQVRQIALSHLLPQTPPGSPHRNIFFSGLQAGGLQAKAKETDVIRDLKLLCRDQLNIAHDAFRALVNLSDSLLLLTPLSEANFLTFIVSYIINPQSILADLASMLLSNLTASSIACSAVLSLNVSIIPTPSFHSSFYATQSRCGTSPAPEPYPSDEPREVLALPLLLDAFVHGAQVNASDDLFKRTRKGELHFLASVFANVSVAPAGRTFFLTPRPTNFLKPHEDFEYPLAKIIPFTEHKDTIRRGGVASTIKNCAFHAPSHKAILSPESIKVSVPPSSIEAPGMDALQYILLPLAGPEEFDLEDQEKLPEALQFLPPTKTRESDPTLRLTHVETLLLLCHTRWGRDYLRDHGVYEIVRATHENETVDRISEHIERLVNLLKGDEPSDAKGEEEEEEAIVPSTGSSAEATREAESDDEDSRIEEV